MTFEEAMNERELNVIERELNVIERELNVIGKTLAEVERLKKSVTELSNLLTASLSGGLYLEQENEQLKEALKMCSPYTIFNEFDDDYQCVFCSRYADEQHQDDCEYIRLIGGVAND
jgi:hypothetical protein